MPPSIRKRGHPKGHEVTVISLPAKKQKKSTTGSCKLRLQPFIKLHMSIKEKGMWYVNNLDYTLSILMHMVTLHIMLFVSIYSFAKLVCGRQNYGSSYRKLWEISYWRRGHGNKARKVPDAVLDENVDIHLIQTIFSCDAWLVVTNVIKQKEENPSFMCKSCYHDLHEQPSVVCEHCLSWYHMRCIILKQQPKARHWHCTQ